MSERPWVWIVEEWWDGRWLPTRRIDLTKRDALLELADWQEQFPGGRFRLQEYRRRDRANG